MDMSVRSSPSGPLRFLSSISVELFGAFAGAGASVTTTAVNAALAYANATGCELYWPEGDYNVSANLVGLHTVKHHGPGAIARDGNRFYVEPRGSQTNDLYVSPTGSNSNDGLTSALPRQTAQSLFDAINNYGPVLDGFWRGNFAAGTYPTLNASFTTPSRNIVTFRGPTVASIITVPTAVISGTGAASSDFGMRASGPGVQVMWRDLRFTLYNHASTNNIALLSDYGSDLWTYNVHVDNSTGQGIYGENCQTVRMSGGIIDGCRQGILLNACNMVTLGYGHASAADGIVRNCTQAGVEWSRGTNGHLDYMTLQSNAVGLDVMHVSRTHIMGCAFTSNTRAIRARSGGYYLLDTSITSTFTTNTNNFDNYAYSGETDANLWVGPSEYRRAYSTNSITHTGSVAKTTLLLAWTIPQNFFVTASANASIKKIKVVVHGQFTTAGALSLIGVDFDGVTIDQSAPVAPGANTKFRYELEIWADGSAAQYKSATLSFNGGVVVQQQGSTAQNMANAARNLNITGQLANAADSMRIDRTEVWVSG